MEPIILEKPIARPGGDITQLVPLAQPTISALQGVSMRALLDMEPDAVAKVIPRLFEPMLAKSEIAALPLPDLLKIGVTIASFFMPKDMGPLPSPSE